MLYIANNWGSILQVVGGVCEILGALFLANRYLNVRLLHVPKLILRSLRPYNKGDVARVVYDFSNERIRLSIRGIFLLCLGFIFQAMPAAISLLKPVFVAND